MAEAAEPVVKNGRSSSTRGAAAWLRRYAGRIKLLAAAVIIICLFVIMNQLPVGAALERLGGWITDLGVIGRVVYGVIYILAALMLVPGSVLTIGAGTIFGLLWGAVIASLAATTAAALALLIGRYFARHRIERIAAGSPKFRAMDRAISEGGWKVVALLRLSPAVPFNLQNYFYGLTSIRFWPCVLTSWVAMLPGTFLYVYFGYLIREVGEQAAKGEAKFSIGRWVLLGLGLAATVAVTVYITRLARKALRAHTDIEASEPSKESPSTKDETMRTPGKGWPWGVVVAMGAALLMLLAAVTSPSWASSLASLFGPKEVTLKEAYANDKGGPAFDHSRFDALLKKHVTAEGWVRYSGLKSDADELTAYIKAIGDAPFKRLSRDEKLALLINAYNAFTLQLILDFDVPASIMDIPSRKRWDARRWKIGDMTLSLSELEHDYLRAKFIEPRIHFAINCASVGCPPLRRDAYTAAKLEEQLAAAAKQVHDPAGRWLRYDEDKNTVHLTKIYQWYRGDFEQVAAGDVLAYVARHSDEVAAALQAGRRPAIKWLDYDWSLNRPPK